MKKYREEEIEQIWLNCVDNKIQQKKDEWVGFLNELNEINNSNLNILEIGCYDGGTTFGLKSFAKKMTTIDMIPSPRFSLETFNEIDYSYIGRSSQDQETIDEVNQKFKYVDIFFIDGDHTYAGVKADFEKYKHLLKSGSIVAFHDIADSDHHRLQGCTVSDFWNEIKTQYKYKEIITPEIIWGGIGILYI